MATFGEKLHDYNRWCSQGGAHEGIRPTHMVAVNSKSPELNKLYQLIFDRSVASQMKPAIVAVTRSIYAGAGKTLFCLEKRTIKLKSFLAFYLPSKKAIEVNADVKVSSHLTVRGITAALEKSTPPKRLSEGSIVSVRQGHDRPRGLPPRGHPDAARARWHAEPPHRPGEGVRLHPADTFRQSRAEGDHGQLPAAGGHRVHRRDGDDAGPDRG